MTTLDCRSRPAPPWLVVVATALGVFVGVMQCSAGCGVDDPCEKAQHGAMRALLPAVALAGCFTPTGSETDAIQVPTGTETSPNTTVMPTTGVDVTATTTTSWTSSSGTAVEVTGSTADSSSSLGSTTDAPTSSSSTTSDTTMTSTSDGPVCFHYHGPSHTFLGMMSTVFVTDEPFCSPSGGNIDLDAEFFCRGFYGPNCFPVPGYKPGVAQEGDAKMHRGNGCYLTLEYIPGTLCYPQLNQGCTITNLWDEVKTGITDLACACPCDDEGWGDEGWSTT